MSNKTDEQIVSGLVYGDANFPDRDLSLATRIVAALRASNRLVVEPTDEQVEIAAEGIWREIAARPSWMTWEQRIDQEHVHKGDPSWGGMTDRCREYARAALTAAGVAPQGPMLTADQVRTIARAEHGYVNDSDNVEAFVTSLVSSLRVAGVPFDEAPFIADGFLLPSAPQPPSAEHDLDRMGICRSCGQGISARELIDGIDQCHPKTSEKR